MFLLDFKAFDFLINRLPRLVDLIDKSLDLVVEVVEQRGVRGDYGGKCEWIFQLPYSAVDP